MSRPVVVPLPLVEPYVTAETGEGLLRISANDGGAGCLQLLLVLSSFLEPWIDSAVSTDMALVNAVAYESPLLESLSVSPAAAEVMVIGGCVSGIDDFAVSVMFFNMFGHCCPIHWRNFPKCLWWTRIFHCPLSCPL